MIHNRCMYNNILLRNIRNVYKAYLQANVESGTSKIMGTP